jgi:hypothetical protein
MIKVDDAAILKRARELCTKGRRSWDWTERTHMATIDQEGRRRYLALAREQLLGESAFKREQRSLEARENEKRAAD